MAQISGVAGAPSPFRVPGYAASSAPVPAPDAVAQLFIRYVTNILTTPTRSGIVLLFRDGNRFPEIFFLIIPAVGRGVLEVTRMRQSPPDSLRPRHFPCGPLIFLRERR